MEASWVSEAREPSRVFLWKGPWLKLSTVRPPGRSGERGRDGMSTDADALRPPEQHAGGTNAGWPVCHGSTHVKMSDPAASNGESR